VFGGLPSVVQECCWDICEKSVMGFVLLSVCQSLLNLMLGIQMSGVLICHLGWEGDSKSLSYTGASLEAEMDMLAGFSQGASRDVGRITISPITPLTGVKGGEAQLVNACVLSVYSLFCTGAHMPETPLYRSVCLVRCNSDR